MKRILSAVIVVLVLAAPVQAANRFVRCVQQQLNALGHDAGLADGLLGKRTRAALALAVVEEPRLAELPRISNRYAVTWCRMLGKYKATLKAFYPSRSLHIVNADSGDNNYQQDAIRRLSIHIRSWFNESFDVRLASRADIVASSSPQRLAKRLRVMQSHEGVPQTPVKRVQKKCDRSEELAAFADQNFIILCFKGRTDFSKEWMRKWNYFLSRVIAHEYFHAVQFEYAADKLPVRYLKKNGPPKSLLRPSWMVEGSAEFFANLYVNSRLGKKANFSKIFFTASTHKQSLRKISRTEQLEDWTDYAVSHLAAHLLGTRFGAEAVLEYWQNIGFGMTHAESFQAEFGMTEAEFGAIFEEVRTDFGKAKNYADGAD